MKSCGFVMIGSFSLGMLYEQRSYRVNHPITVEYSQEAIDLWDTCQNIKDQGTEYFGSKKGSIVYPIGCKKGNRINEENKIFFVDIEQAIDLGYREVEGC